MLQKTYTVSTTKSADDIFADIAVKIAQENQEKTSVWLQPINYRSFKITKNQITINRNLSMSDPLRGWGIIYFKFDPIKDGTLVTCTIELFTRYANLIGLTLLLSCLLIITIFLLAVCKVTSGILLFLGATWTAPI